MLQYPILRYAHILFWVVYGALEHISHLVYGENHWQGSLFAPILAMVCTGAIALFYERTEEKSVYYRGLGLGALSLVTILLWHNLTRILHFQISFNELLDSSILTWMAGSTYSILLLLTWTGLFVSGYIFLQKKAQQTELLHIKNTAREAQLQQLLYQINPHFLFNVLNSIDVAILDKQNDAAHNMVVKLSCLLRSTLEHKFNNKITLKDEMTLLGHFIAIEQQRFHQQIRFENNIQPDALNAYIPPLLLQPLMENAIKFSWQLGVDCTITLNAHVEDRQLKVLICNPFDTRNYCTSSGTQTGLENVKHRLSLLYGKAASLHVCSEHSRFEVLLSVPFEVGL